MISWKKENKKTNVIIKKEFISAYIYIYAIHT